MSATAMRGNTCGCRSKQADWGCDGESLCSVERRLAQFFALFANGLRALRVELCAKIAKRSRQEPKAYFRLESKVLPQLCKKLHTAAN